ncbi:unnamed protein product [Dovyalis caffra]|uniref:Uncharacterized protein n=1 Tax=Dovyalis caffra TaxID=77055 RepID=A0AAV1SQY5_9ROSI|nr:unnamed protein product [Dovyalis caffra]
MITYATETYMFQALYNSKFVLDLFCKEVCLWIVTDGARDRFCWLEIHGLHLVAWTVKCLTRIVSPLRSMVEGETEIEDDDVVATVGYDEAVDVEYKQDDIGLIISECAGLLKQAFVVDTNSNLNWLNDSIRFPELITAIQCNKTPQQAKFLEVCSLGESLDGLDPVCNGARLEPTRLLDSSCDGPTIVDHYYSSSILPRRVQTDVTHKDKVALFSSHIQCCPGFFLNRKYRRVKTLNLRDSSVDSDGKCSVESMDSCILNVNTRLLHSKFQNINVQEADSLDSPLNSNKVRTETVLVLSEGRSGGTIVTWNE